MSRLEEFMGWMGLVERPLESTGDDQLKPGPRSAPEKFQRWVVDHARAIRLGLVAYLIVLIGVAVIVTGRPGESALTVWTVVACNILVVALLLLVSLPAAKRRTVEREASRPDAGPRHQQ